MSTQNAFPSILFLSFLLALALLRQVLPTGGLATHVALIPFLRLCRLGLMMAFKGCGYSNIACIGSIRTCPWPLAEGKNPDSSRSKSILTSKLSSASEMIVALTRGYAVEAKVATQPRKCVVRQFGFLIWMPCSGRFSRPAWQTRLLLNIIYLIFI